jgi:hypothetical protein
MEVTVVESLPNLQTVASCNIIKKCSAIAEVKYKTQHKSCINVRRNMSGLIFQRLQFRPAASG